MDDARTLVVGDLHCKGELVLPRVDAAASALGATRVVLCGDYVDEWHSNELTMRDALDVLRDWVRSRRGEGLAVDLVLGNHDAQYLLREPGPGTHEGLYDEVAGLLAELGVRAAATVGTSLVTHAGVTGAWARAHLAPARGLDASEACLRLNALLDGGTEKGLRALAQAGPGRGGFELPGPLWADQAELWRDPLPEVDQIVGHTPVESVDLWNIPTADGVHTSCHLVFCDTMSLSPDLVPGGDGSMLLAEGRSVRAVTDEELGLAPWPLAVCDWMETCVLPFLNPQGWTR